MHVSPSQISLHKSCPRKWGWAYIKGLKITQPAQKVGLNLHKKIENYLLKNEIPNINETLQPSIKSRMYYTGEVALNAIENLPVKDENLDILGVEENFDFIFVDKVYTKNIKIKFTGLIDFIFAHTDYDHLQVWDHKTSANPEKYAKTKEDLLIDPQAIIYSFYVFERNNWIDELEFTLNYIDTFPNRNHSKKVTILLDYEYVFNAMLRHIIPTALKIYEAKKEIENPLLLDYNSDECEEYGGCPYKNKCRLRLKERIKNPSKERIQKWEKPRIN